MIYQFQIGDLVINKIDFIFHNFNYHNQICIITDRWVGEGSNREYYSIIPAIKCNPEVMKIFVHEDEIEKL